MKKTRKQTVKTLGEHKIIQIIQSHLTPMPNIPISFGDDVSAVSLNHKLCAILKTDMLVSKTDAPKKMTLFQAAKKAIVMNISDFASKGVQPIAALVGLGLPRTFTQKDVKEIAEGLNTAAREYGTYIIGGDTGEATDLVISVSLFGTAEKSKLMLRSGARPGDTLAVTGSFGKSSSGLRLLLGDFRASADLRQELLKTVFLPKAQLAQGLALSKCGVISASIDSSDGLAWSLHEIGRLSSVGFILNRIPVAKEVFEFAELNSLDAYELALYGGEEYELVVTVKPKKWNYASAAIEAVGGQLLPIGKVTEGHEVLADFDGKKQVIEARGWEHFKKQV
jgi:thiamine-monophosphate kinase